MAVMAICVQPPGAHLSSRDIEMLEKGSLLTEASVGQWGPRIRTQASQLGVLCMTLEWKMFLITAPTFWDLLWGESKVLRQKSLRVYQAILH